jgi:hypothetical protein
VLAFSGIISPMSAVQSTPTKDFYIHVGAPDPIIVRYRAGGSEGTLVAFDSSLKFTFSNLAGTVTLGVGTGITLSTDETVASARATIQMTVAQSRTIPEGPITHYEIQRTTEGREEVFLMGSLIGQGGDNPDAA